jgi:DNA polymerase-3 subunit gamma/tau
LKTLEEPPAHAIFILATTEKHKILPTILSRCQIFDFKRITIDDAANHLARIAQKESITADADALHIIAQKADGAMRDALSIFDRMVTFCGNNLSYDAVIENLNILDYDYFFDVVGNSITGNISKLLLIYNNVLDKGFDGQHFLSGLAEHLRNILIASDSKTLVLLEVGDNIKRKYVEQASNTTSGFVLEALRIINKADQDYKQANNKRLTVELALMNIATIGKHLVFSNEKNVDSSAQHQTKLIENATTHPQQQPAKVEKPVEAIKVNPGSLSLGSLKSPNNSVEEKKKIINEDVPNLLNKVEESSLAVLNESKEFQEDAPPKSLNEVWKEYTEIILASKKVALHATLTIHPIRLEGKNIILPVDNSAQAESLIEEKIELMNYIRNQLKDYELTFETVILKPNLSNEVKPYTDKEKFEKMASQNPTLLKFQESFGFEFEY